MRVPIDAAGRLVLPKAIRDALGLRAGTEIDVEERDGHIELTPIPAKTRLVRRGKLLVAERTKPAPTLRAASVREVLESVRR